MCVIICPDRKLSHIFLCHNASTGISIPSSNALQGCVGSLRAVVQHSKRALYTGWNSCGSINPNLRARLRASWKHAPRLRSACVTKFDAMSVLKPSQCTGRSLISSCMMPTSRPNQHSSRSISAVRRSVIFLEHLTSSQTGIAQAQVRALSIRESQGPGALQGSSRSPCAHSST